MSFEPHTLLFLTAIILVTVGLLLIFAWAQNPSHRSLAIWGIADLIYAVAFGLLLTRNHAPEIVSVGLAFATVAAGHAGIWAGTRTFYNRPIRLLPIVAGPVLCFAACLSPHLLQAPEWRMVLMSAVAVTYMGATAWELWHDGGERLLSRYPMLGCLFLHVTLLTGRGLVGLVWTLPRSSDMLDTPWVVAMGIDPMIAVIVAGFLQLSMTKERNELVQRRVAATDALTGVGSRRAFFCEGEQRLKSAVQKGRQAVLLLFDLDRFKEVNDTYGHHAGDCLLQAFAVSTSNVLRRTDLFGRIGGEEFAALLIGMSIDVAAVVAERCRAAMQETEFVMDGQPIRLTVSVGVSMVAGAGCDIEGLLAQADRALYEAKSTGRNCVQRYRPDTMGFQLVA